MQQSVSSFYFDGQSMQIKLMLYTRWAQAGKSSLVSGPVA